MKHETTSQAFVSRLVPTMPMILFLGLALHMGSCQERPENDRTEEVLSVLTGEPAGYEDDSVHSFVTVPPAFPGGETARLAFLQENLVYPAEALETGIQGTVFVSFIVRHDGQVTDVKLLRGVDSQLDQEVTRVMALMPAWDPGRLSDGTPVSVIFNMPVRFVAGEMPLSQRIPRGREGEVLVMIGEEIFIKSMGEPTTFDDLISPEDIESLTVITDEQALEEFGYETVILITRKE